jgi:pimeloyl-ACP methyl ester carboxylesterase
MAVTTPTYPGSGDPGQRRTDHRPERLEGSYVGLATRRIRTANGVECTYRDTAPDDSAGVPLVLLQRFRGNLDNWDPALIDALASQRRVITFNKAGVGSSTGTTPRAIGQMARDAIAFLDALDLASADLLGFSIGSFVAQEIGPSRPGLVRRLVLASAATQGAAGMYGWAAEVIGAIGNSHTRAEQYLDVLFTPSEASRQAGWENLKRMSARTENPDTPTSWAIRLAQYDAVCAWGVPDHALLQRLSCLQMPVFVGNGDSNLMILPHYSPVLAGLIPQARLEIYADSAHGFPVPAPRGLRRGRRGLPQLARRPRSYGSSRGGERRAILSHWRRPTERSKGKAGPTPRREARRESYGCHAWRVAAGRRRLVTSCSCVRSSTRRSSTSS